jgi:hypothetical protein
MKTLIAVMSVLTAAAAFAEDNKPVVTATQSTTEAPHHFSVIGGDTVGASANVLEASLGYPGLTLGYVHGMRRDLDLGARVELNGTYEGLTFAPSTGIKGQGVVKLRLLDAGRTSLGLELAPGLFAYNTRFGTAGGAVLGAGVKFGIAATDRLGIGIATESPFFFAFAPLRVADVSGPGSVVYPGGLYVPILFGGGVEYALAPNLLLTGDVRMGPTFITATSTAMFTLQAKAGVAWRI